MSQEFSTTLTRAIDNTKTLQQTEVTLEHLLVSLIEDQDAHEMLRISNVDTQRLAGEVLTYTDRLEKTERAPNEGQIFVHKDLKRVMEAGASAAMQGGRKEITGAIVLAAIVGDGKSVAAEFLRSRGLTFEQAIRAIQRTLAASSSPASSQHREAPRYSSEHIPVSEEGPLPTEGGNVLNQDGSSEEAEQSFSSSMDAPSYENIHEEKEEELLPLEAYPLSSSDHSQSRSEPSLSSSPTKPLSGHFSPRPPSFAKGYGKPQRGTAALLNRPLGASQNPLPPFGAASGPSRSEGGEYNTNAQVPRSSGRGSLPLHSNGPTLQTGRKYIENQVPLAPQSTKGGQTRKGPVQVAASQLVENIPRRMRVLRPILVEAKVSRAHIQALSEALEGGGAVYRHEIAITKAVSVRLRAPQGGFWIENASPETQWIENILGVVSDEYIRWRWTVTPKSSGKKPLQILISARTLGTDGVAAETALPDRVIQVKVRPDYSKRFLSSLNWLIFFSLFGLAVRYWEGIQEKINLMIHLLTTQWPWIERMIGHGVKAFS